MSELNNNNNRPYAFTFKKASVGKRIGAFLIDHLIISFVLYFVGGFVLTGLYSALNPSEASAASLTLLLSLVILAVTFLIYIFRDVVKGQSIGKRLLGIGVRDVSDNFLVPPASRLILRQLFAFVWPIEFLVLLFSDENRKIGDKIAGTGVYYLRDYDEFISYMKRAGYIKQEQTATQYSDSTESLSQTVELQNPKRKSMVTTIVIVILAGVLFISAMFFGIVAMIRNHPSYQVATQTIKASPEITAIIGEVESFGFMPSGNINTSSGRGDASFTIIARGSYGEVRVFVDLEMRAGSDWEIVRFNFVQIR